MVLFGSRIYSGKHSSVYSVDGENLRSLSVPTNPSGILTCTERLRPAGADSHTTAVLLCTLQTDS